MFSDSLCTPISTSGFSLIKRILSLLETLLQMGTFPHHYSDCAFSPYQNRNTASLHYKIFDIFCFVIHSKPPSLCMTKPEVFHPLKALFLSSISTLERETSAAPVQ
jgi:hypothetical protein